MGSMIDVKRPDGGTCKGYLAEAGKGKLYAWGPMPELPEVGTTFANPLATVPDLHWLDIQEIAQINPRVDHPVVSKPTPRPQPTPNPTPKPTPVRGKPGQDAP